MFADQLSRLRVAVATGILPADLGAWAVAELAARASAADRRELRDALLSAAARALLPEGSTWARASALQAELAALDRSSSGISAGRQLVAEALAVDPATPRSVRHLHTILKSTASRFQTVPAEGESR